jgi:helix-turn-helix protein
MQEKSIFDKITTKLLLINLSEKRKREKETATITMISQFWDDLSVEMGKKVSTLLLVF